MSREATAFEATAFSPISEVPPCSRRLALTPHPSQPSSPSVLFQAQLFCPVFTLFSLSRLPTLSLLSPSRRLSLSVSLAVSLWARVHSSLLPFLVFVLLHGPKATHLHTPYMLCQMLFILSPTTALFSVKRTAPQICHSLSVSNRFCFSLHFHAAGAFLRFLCSTSTVTPMRCQYCACCCASRAAAVTAANLLPPALRHTALFASEKLFLRFAPCLALDATLPTPLSFLCPFPFIWRGRRASVVSFWASRLWPCVQDRAWL